MDALFKGAVTDCPPIPEEASGAPLNVPVRPDPSQVPALLPGQGLSEMFVSPVLKFGQLLRHNPRAELTGVQVEAQEAVRQVLTCVFTQHGAVQTSSLTLGRSGPSTPQDAVVLLSPEGTRLDLRWAPGHAPCGACCTSLSAPCASTSEQTKMCKHANMHASA